MLTVEDAFYKFKSRLELNTREQDNASARQKEVREYLDGSFSIERSFLTGSYARHTKTKPLKDIDIFFQLGAKEKHYRDKKPAVVLAEFSKVLIKKYGDSAVRPQTRSVNVDFGVVIDANDKTDYRIVSVDVVPAFASGGNYEIADTKLDKWIFTNPEVHAEKATQAHKDYSQEWKGLVRMLKYWNGNAKHGEKVVKPSFLIEVMALECLHGGWQGRFDYEIQAAFATLSDRIHHEWADPAGLGPPISDGMDASQKERAKRMLLAAGREASLAINCARQGRVGDALKAWRALFGPRFPLS